MHRHNVVPRPRIYSGKKAKTKQNKKFMMNKRTEIVKKISMHSKLKLTLSGKISAIMTYGTGRAPHDAMNIIAEKLTTGIHWNASRLMLVLAARKI